MSTAQMRDILDAVLCIPEGRVASYGRVAEMAGWPRRARLVGTALRTLTGGTHIPWHRVLRADGRIAFPTGDPRQELQTELLRQEGVTVQCGRVDMQRFGWQGS